MTKPTSEQVTFTAAGSGATLRNLVDKVREAVSVKDFGAVGDGVTDDTAAIQAAMSSGASTVYVPKGVYGINAQISILANVTVRGDGRGSEFKMLSSLDTMFSIAGDNVHFRELAMRGTDTEISGSLNERCIVAIQRSNVTVTACELMETVIAVQYDECDNCSLLDCDVHNIRHRIDLSQGYGILCNDDCENIVISNNRFATIGRHAVYVSSGSSNAVVCGNVVDGCESVALTSFATSSQNPCRNISFTGNAVRDVSGSVAPVGIGVYVNVEDIVIANNCIRSTQSFGIEVQGGLAELQANNPRRISICGNSVDAASTGIRTINSSDLVVSGNIVRDSGVGIAVTSDASGVGGLFSNAIISGNMALNSTTFGLNVSGSASCTGIQLSGNTFRNSGTRDYHLPTISGTALLPAQIKFSDAVEQYVFTVTSLTAGLTDQVLNAPIAGLVAYRVAGKRYAVSMTATMSSAITAGTATVTLFAGGTAQTAYDVVLNSSASSATNVQAIRRSFATTEDIIVKVTTDGSFATASTANLTVVVRMVDLAD